MKSLKFFSAALAVALAFTGCEKPVVSGVDVSVPAPKDLAINAEASTSSVLVVDWDGSECVQAGAKSFVVKVNTTAELFDYKNDKDKSNFTQTIAAVDTIDIYSAKFSGLVPGEYCVMVRANYPRSVYSEWVFLAAGEDTTYTKITLAPPVITKVEPGAKNLFVHFDAKDAEYVKKYGITGIEVQYKEVSASDWTSFGRSDATSKSVTIDSGIKPLTTYVVRARYLSPKYSSEWTVSDEATTTEAKELTIAKAQDLIDAMKDELSASSPITVTADLDFAGLSLPKGKNLPCAFDGAGHTIKNLKLTGPMFANITSTGSIKNLVIDSSCEYTTSMSGFHAVVAAKSAGKIENITNKANVTLEYAADATALTVIAGIVAEAVDITGCTNEGNVIMKAPIDNFLKGSLVGGVVGYASGNVDNCHNKGEVRVEGGCIAWAAADRYFYGTAAIQEAAGAKALPIHLGGVVCDIAGNVTNCTNSGHIVYSLTKMEGLTTGSIGTNCPRIGGVVGCVLNGVEHCLNSGKIDVVVTPSTRQALQKVCSNNYTTKVGGVAGGCNNLAGIVTAWYTDCHNTGDIVFDIDADKSNNTIGGVVGYPGGEAKSESWIDGCSNSGKLTVTGYGQTRVGGIAGGSGNIRNSTNSGDITSTQNTAAAGIGGIMGWQTYGHQIIGCTNTGDVATSTKNYVGGISGGVANTSSFSEVIATIKGCKVNCNIVSENAERKIAGMVVGSLTGSPNSKNIVIEAKVKGTISVAGTVTTVTADNAKELAIGTNSYNPEIHDVTITYGE